MKEGMKWRQHRAFLFWAGLFFEDIHRFGQLTERLGLLPGCSFTGEEPEYGYLFWGTHADITVPIWASACVGEGDALLNATTLEVLACYYRQGYRPVGIDGNPPDFIGEMVRFWEYQSACFAHDEVEEEDEALINQYLLPTAKAAWEAVEKACPQSKYAAVLRMLLDWCEQGGLPAWSGRQWGGLMEEAVGSFSQEALESGRLPPIVMEEEHTVPTAGRNNCGGKCVITARVREGCLLKTGTDQGPAPRLAACVRGMGYRKTYLSPQRLRYPMLRVGKRGEGRFRRISWEEAAEYTAGEWRRIRSAYGPASTYVNYATGVTGVLRPDNMVRRLLNLDGGFLEGYNSYSSACSRYITPYIYGDNDSGNCLEDLENTRLLLLWGHNPAETIFGTERGYYIRKARENGARVIVIDPRNSDTARAWADEWVGIRPSTDSALADAMAYVIWSEGLQDQPFMDACCLGFDEAHMPPGIPPEECYRAYLFGERDGTPKTPAWGEAVTGVPAGDITRLARLYAATKPACLLPGLGPQRTGNGEQAVRGMAMLACLTGNVGVRGGGAAGAGGVKGHATPAYPVGENPFPGSIPTFLWTKAVESPAAMNRRDDGLKGVERLESGVKLLFNLGGNTLVNQHSDINNSIRILQDESLCESIICSDVFMTPSARFADLLLPATSFLEDDNITAPWSYGNYLLYNNRVVKPLFGCRFEYWWLRDVAARLGLAEAWEGGHKGMDGWLAGLYEELRGREPELPPYEKFRQSGVHRYRNNRHYIAFEQQVADPEANPFPTPSGKIEIFSKRIYDWNDRQAMPPIPRYVPCPEGPEDPARQKYPLQLIGWHTKRRCHSIHDSNREMERLEPQRAWMHPADALPRGIADGDTALLFNSRGCIRMPVHVTERIVPGVVAVPQGAWYRPEKNGVDTRGSVNVLTSTRPTPFAKGNPQHTNLVQVEKEKNTRI